MLLCTLGKYSFSDDFASFLADKCGLHLGFGVLSRSFFILLLGFCLPLWGSSQLTLMGQAKLAPSQLKQVIR